MLALKLPDVSVEDIQVIDNSKYTEVRGRWNSKSGGVLTVPFALPRSVVSALLDYDNPAFDAVEEDSGVDIRGLRAYRVDDIPAGSIGGLEWHMARTEYVSTYAGTAVWRCVDPKGREREFVLDGKTAIVQPPGIVHTYEALEEGTGLQLVCNTLFVPDDKRTHDTFSREAFDQLGAQITAR